MSRGRGRRGHSRPIEYERPCEDSDAAQRDNNADIADEQTVLKEIANTMREINKIVDIKKLNIRLKKLLTDLKKCSTPFEHAMAINDFNTNYGP